MSYCVIDKEKGFTPVKSGFKTAAKANEWCKKNLPRDDVHLWGEKIEWGTFKPFRYFVIMKQG